MEIVISVAAKVAEYLVAPIVHPFTYCCTYKTNFEKLNNEVGKLKNARDSMQYKVDDSRIKGDGIQQHVEEWLIAANKEINEVETLIEDKENSNNRCLKGLCPNLRTRYQLSKKAEREANAIVGLHEKGRFDSVSFRTIPEETWLKSTLDFMHFESRKSILKEILDALSNRNFNMIGVYGMGGIGKTTLVKEVGRQAKENNLFEKVISSRVSQTPQIKEIQREIAEKLGLKIDEESETVRAWRLLEQLKKETKILIILDDIWGSLDLEAIGIPLADDNGGCKVLLTARSQDVLSCKMDCQHNFFVDVLNENEARSLFKKMTGDCIENGELKSVGAEIVEECAGLPIAIVPVAKALKNKSVYEWRNALRQLKRPFLRSFSGTQAVAAYSTIELSYNQLGGEELRKTFLLIGYSYICNVKDLLYHGMGLGLFPNINTVDEARDRAHTLVDKLKTSCLLLDGDTSEWFSMHDVVRDVAISIASRDQHVFAVENEVVPLTSWPDKDALKVCTAISLFNTDISELPQGFECPQLKYFRIRNDPSLRIPDNIFTEMTELRVLDFTEMHLLALPSSLGLLQNLQALSLDYCKLRDMAIIGDLKKLDILTLRGSNMQKLVEEIGRLTQLRLLDLSNCFNLIVIPPNAISSLSRLEELYIGESPIMWGKVGGVDGERRNASLDELNNLSKLTSLEILIQDEKALPRDLSFFKMLQRYRILIGNCREYGAWDGISRMFRLSLTNGDNICLNEGHIMQLKGIEDLTLDGLPDIKNILCELGREGFPHLNRLEIGRNGNIVRLVDTMDCTPARTTAFPLLESLFLRDLRNLEEICRGPLTAESFSKLKTIRMEGCDKLKKVFPLVIGRGLQQLQSIEVSSCQNMEVIFAAERGDESSNNNGSEVIELTQLRKLELRSLPQLTSFCTGDLHFEKVFPNLEELRVDEKHICLFPEDWLCKFKCLDVWLDESSTILSLDDFLQRFHTIKILSIGGNNQALYTSFKNVENGMNAIVRGINHRRDLKQIFKQESTNTNDLEKLEIFECDNLINLVPSSISFQNLTTLTVGLCHGMINVLTSSTARSLVRLRQMRISCCEMITEIVADEDDQGDNYAAKDEIVFSELKELELWDLESLTSFICSGNNCAFEFPSLETLLVDRCPNMKIFSEGELSTPKLQKVQLSVFDNKLWAWDRDLNTTIQYVYLKRKKEEKEKENKKSAEANEKEKDAKDSGKVKSIQFGRF
ncbi:putative disease resistance protein [Citrus sinensis]|nr:putative disease resistance protein [Citrus sinensis]